MAYKNFTKIIIKKLLLFLSLVLFISFISFLLMDLSPIDPINAFGRSQGIGLSHEKKAQLIIKWGLEVLFNGGAKQFFLPANLKIGTRLLYPTH